MERAKIYLLCSFQHHIYNLWTKFPERDDVIQIFYKNISKHFFTVHVMPKAIRRTALQMAKIISDANIYIQTSIINNALWMNEICTNTLKEMWNLIRK